MQVECPKMTAGAGQRAATRGILYYSVLPGHSAEVGRESRIGRALALAAVSGLRDRAPDAAAFVWPYRGKPRVAGGPQFSIAHSAPLVACVAVDRGAVGFDVECDARADSLAFAHVFDDAERDLAALQGARRVWMAKEAALKAHGGTIEHIGSVRVDATGAAWGARRYFRHDITIAGRWAACVMTDVRELDIEQRAIDPPA
jgi:hypothetical protein